MPRQRNNYNIQTYNFTQDFPERLERLKEEPGLSWSEIARRLGAYPHTLWRWREKGVQPHIRHLMALLELADSLGLGHVFTDWRVRPETRPEMPGPAGSGRSSKRVLKPNAPTRCRSAEGRGRMSARRLRARG